MPYRPLRKPPAGTRETAKVPAGPAAVVAGVTVTDADRMVYAPLGVTKLHLARFYETIADWAVPHMHGRPTTLVRCPRGVPCHFERHDVGWAPEAVRRVPIQEKTKVGEYAVVEDVRDLVRLVEIDVREIHTWNASLPHVEHPDRVVFDLDPGEGVASERLVDAALEMRDRLQALGLASFVKTTGGHSFHVVVPARVSSWSEGLVFAQKLVRAMEGDDPGSYTTNMSKGLRQGRIYLDYLRNARGSTSVAAFSTRASMHGRVSVPVGWEELRSLGTRQFAIPDLLRRLLALKSDPWSDYAERRQTLPKTVR